MLLRLCAVDAICVDEGVAERQRRSFYALLKGLCSSTVIRNARLASAARARPRSRPSCIAWCIGTNLSGGQVRRSRFALPDGLHSLVYGCDLLVAVAVSVNRLLEGHVIRFEITVGSGAPGCVLGAVLEREEAKVCEPGWV